MQDTESLKGIPKSPNEDLESLVDPSLPVEPPELEDTIEEMYKEE